LSSGTTSITVAAPGLAAGPHSLTATYSGSATFAGSVGVRNFTVLQAPTTLALQSSQNPSPVGTSVTFTATVSSTTGAIPEGSVSFSTNQFAQTVQTSGGVATVTIPFQTKGNIRVTAVFSDQSFKTATTSVVQTVQ
jgi:redox-regulated HSP33 family molecular chaperone